MINIEQRVEKARELFKQGYNCSQAVVLAYNDIIPIDKKQLATISAVFGGGMGRLGEVCGSVSGMFMVSSFVVDASNPQEAESKKKSYETVQLLAKQFTQHNGSIVCRELLGLVTKHDEPSPEKKGKEYYKKRPCSEYVGYCAELVGKLINSNESI